MHDALFFVNKNAKKEEFRRQKQEEKPQRAVQSGSTETDDTLTRPCWRRQCPGVAAAIPLRHSQAAVTR